jgi:LysR family nitrogen assimilation transcriptional regulator
METRRLQAFVRMVDVANLTRAAQSLGITQPALSQQLTALEEEFGVQLLERTRSGVQPTPGGQALYRHATLILNQIENARADVAAARKLISGNVSIGMPLSVTAVMIVPLLRTVGERYPGISLDFTDGLPAAIAGELVASRRLDIAFLSAPTKDKSVATEELVVERLALITSPNNPLGQSKSPIALRDLKDHPLILPNHSVHLRKIVDDAFASVKVEPKVVAEMNSVYALCSATSAGLGSAIVPFSTSELANPHRFVRRKIIRPELVRPIYLATAGHTELSSQAKAVYDIIIEIKQQMIADGVWRPARPNEPSLSPP